MNSWIKKQKNLLTSSTSFEAISIDDNSKFLGYINDDAALDSFKNHWIQAWNIMQIKTTNEQTDGDHLITSDDVTTIINHIESIISLLVQENQKLKQLNENQNSRSTPIMMSPLLDYLLMESVLDKLFNWSSNIGEYTNVMKLAQLKLYELLVSELCHESMLFQTALIRPLLHLLSTCKDCMPLEVEKHLVCLLNRLCIVLSSNTDLLELFFVTDKNKNNNIASSMDEVKSSPQLKNKLSHLDLPESKFLIFSLLISFVHREGSIGRQARDSLLLIMSLSKTHPSIGLYIAENTNFCPVLATGLSGLYSLLPRKLLTEVMSANDWHQLTNEDINEIGELQTFLNSLDFCNAVIKISHQLVKQQLLEYISQGFLISVIGPALHQDIMQFPIEVLETYPKFQNTIEEIIATTAYLELCIRTVTEPDLLQVFLKFIFTEKFDGQRILDTLTTRIACYKKLSLVTIVLFKTLLDLNCEDVMTELIFKYLLNLDFLSENNNQQVERILDSSRLDQSARKLLNCIPINTKVQKLDSSINTSLKSSNLLEKLDSLNFSSDLMMSNSLQNDSFYSLLNNDCLMQNYVDYLNDAHQLIRNCIKASTNWSKYSEYELKKIQARFNELSEKENNLNAANNCNNCLNTMASDLPCEEHHFDKSFNQETHLIGSFLSNLFNKLENYLNNDIYTNLQLTGLVSRLLIYPQPILRSFFFNDTLHIHSKVRTIWKILPKLKYKLEKSLEKIDNYDELIESAKEYFENREKILLNDENDDKSANRQKLNRSPSLQSEKIIINIEPSKDNKKKTIRDFWNRLRNDKSSSIVQKQEIEYVNSKKSSMINKPDCLMKNLSKNQSVVLSVLIFQEFIKEISSISYEHYILANEYSERNRI